MHVGSAASTDVQLGSAVCTVYRYRVHVGSAASTDVHAGSASRTALRACTLGSAVVFVSLQVKDSLKRIQLEELKPQLWPDAVQASPSRIRIACACVSRCFCSSQVDSMATEASALKKRRLVERPFVFVDLQKCARALRHCRRARLYSRDLFRFRPNWAVAVKADQGENELDPELRIESIGQLSSALNTVTKA